MAKSRKFATILNAEVRIGTTPASVRDLLLDIATCAMYNADHTEEIGSPQQKDQQVIYEITKKAAQEINDRCREHWKNS